MGLYNKYSDVSSRTCPRPRGASRTTSSGLGLDDKVLGLGSQVLGLGLGLETKSSARMPRTSTSCWLSATDT